MFGRKNTNIDVPNQPFVNDVDLDVSVSHPLKSKKMVRLIVYFFLAAFFIAGGVLGVKRPFEDASQQSANIASASLFFAVGVLFIVLMFLTFRSKIVVKEVKSVIIGVWAGIRKNTVFVGEKQVYKGRNKNIRVTAGNKIILVHIRKKIIYFE